MQTHSKVCVAVEQLECAIRIYLSGKSFASSLTLAGAAEEILGRAIQLDGGKSALSGLYEAYSEPGLQWMNPPKKWSDFAQREQNRARNALKHLSDGSDLFFEADLAESALCMLIRAIENYNNLGFDPTPAISEFDLWFHENVVGV